MRKIPCEVYSRVVGYFRPVQAWNLGKREEFKDRRPYSTTTSLDSNLCGARAWDSANGAEMNVASRTALVPSLPCEILVRIPDLLPTVTLA